MKQRRHKIDILPVVILAGAFALSAIVLVVLGANVYEKTVSENQQAFQTRTASLYFSQKIHQADSRGAVSLTSLKTGQQALVLSRQDYETWIFVSGGSLREATVKQGSPVTENFGQPVLPLKSLEFRLLGSDLLQITAVSAKGFCSRLNVLVRCSALEVRP